MPNYNYKCLDCYENFEIRTTIKEMENGKILCKNCGSKNIKRIYKGFGIGKSASSCSTCSGGSCTTCGN